MEFSPFTTEIEDEKVGLLKTARELGVKIVAYGALGRGLLTGRYVRTLKDVELLTGLLSFTTDVTRAIPPDGLPEAHPAFLEGELPDHTQPRRRPEEGRREVWCLERTGCYRLGPRSRRGHHPDRGNDQARRESTAFSASCA